MHDDSRGTRGRARRAGPSTLTPPTGLPAAPDAAAPDAAAPDAPVVQPPRTVPRAPVVDPCVCSHGREAHEHWRRGTDCGVCGREGCAAFRPEGGRLRRLLRGGRPPA
jgi:hypothetical protein